MDRAAFKEKLQVNQKDIEERFLGNEDFYFKMVAKVLNDPNYESLKANVAAKNWEDAFKDAHNIKGMTANMSFNAISGIAAELSDVLKMGNYDEAVVMPLFDRLVEVYPQLLDDIKALDN